jgi:DnaJ-class molecular chaperone
MFGPSPTIFISYSRTDIAFVDRLEASLKSSGFRIWVDRSEMKGGLDWLDQVQEALDHCQAVLVVLSPDAAQSEYVLMEYRYAKSQKKLIIPLEYRQALSVPWDLQPIHRIVFHTNYDDGYHDLLYNLNRLIGPVSSPSTAGKDQSHKRHEADSQPFPSGVPIHEERVVESIPCTVSSGDMFQATRSSETRGEHIKQSVEISLAEAYTGTTRICVVQRRETCTTCLGMPREHSKPCKICQGRGQTIQTRSITVNIPAGMETGIKHVTSEGHAGLDGGPEGDLLVFITVTSHPNFTRKGIDLFTTISIDKMTARRGGEALVTLPDDKQLLLTIPPQTPDGKQFRLTGKGMPVFYSSRRGNLFVKVRITTSEQTKA